MNKEQLVEEIEIELENIRKTVNEIISIYQDFRDGQPRVRDITAAAAFLAHFYTGIENILKRICLFQNVPLPKGDIWHSELFRFFCAPSHNQLPELFDALLSKQLLPYRKFRHVVFHGYGFQLVWSRLLEGLKNAPAIFQEFENAINSYLKSI